MATERGTVTQAPWGSLEALLARQGIERLALIGAAPGSGRAFQSEAERRGVRCRLVDGLRHHSARRARDVSGWADLVVVCVSGVIAHRVSEPYRALGRGAVLTVRARGADGIAKELAAGLASSSPRAA